MNKTEIIVTLAVSLLLVIVLACSLLGGAHALFNRFRPNGPDVGMAVFLDDPDLLGDTREMPAVDVDEDHRCHGCEPTCDECGAPMRIPDGDHFDAKGIEIVRCGQWVADDYGIELTEYGSHLVHRHCLMARRDGRVACADCARVMVGAL